MTDNKEVKKMVNDNMDNDNETHNKDNGKAGAISKCYKWCHRYYNT